jgi:hypothetical protein
MDGKQSNQLQEATMLAFALAELTREQRYMIVRWSTMTMVATRDLYSNVTKAVATALHSILPSNREHL